MQARSEQPMCKGLSQKSLNPLSGSLSTFIQQALARKSSREKTSRIAVAAFIGFYCCDGLATTIDRILNHSASRMSVLGSVFTFLNYS
jgi:hypothetical protein